MKPSKKFTLLLATVALGISYTPDAMAACSAYPAGTTNTNAVVGLGDVGSGSGVFTTKASAVTAYGANGLAGMLVYDSTANSLQLCNGTTWLSIATSGSTAAAGSAGQVQFNSSGSLGADAALTWDNTNKRLGIGTATPASQLHVKSASGAAIMEIDRPSGQYGYLNFATAGSRRWHVGISNTTESGSNVGSDYYINRADDSGAYVDTTFSIKRSSGYVGLGTTAPSARLDVYNGASGASPIAGLGALVVQDSTDTGIAILTPNTNIGSLAFGDPQNGAIGRIRYLHSADAMMFQTNGAERMRIDSAGNVAIGGTAAPNTLTLTGVGDITAENAGGGLLIQDSEGASTGDKVRIDANEMQASRNGTAMNFAINPFGGSVGVGDFPGTGIKFDVTDSSTATSGTVIAAQAIETATPTSASSAAYRAANYYTSLNGSVNITGTAMATNSVAQNSSTGTVTTMYGAQNVATQSANATLTTGRGAMNYAQNTSATGAITNAFGAYNYAVNAPSGAGTISNAYGGYNRVLESSVGGSIGTAFGAYNMTDIDDSGSITNAYGSMNYVNISASGAGNISNAYALRANINDAGSGTITNGYGLYIDDIAATNDWAIYQVNSGDDNYFAGNVGIGTNAPASTLSVGGAGNSGWQAYIQGQGTTSSSYALVIRESTGATNSFWVRDDGATYTRGTATIAGTVTASGTIAANGGIDMGGTLNLGSQAIVSSAGTVIDANGGWQRTYGNTGWYNGTYNGGIYMTDTTWVRTYNSKGLYSASKIASPLIGAGGIVNPSQSIETDGNISLANGGTIFGSDSSSSNTLVLQAAKDAYNGGRVATFGRNATWNPGQVQINGATYTNDGTKAVRFLNYQNSSTNNELGYIKSNGDLVVVGSGTNCTIGNNTNATNCSSDGRLKDRLEPITGALDSLVKLKPVYFHWKDPKKSAARNIGLIAQDVQKVYPELVETDDNGYLALSYAGLVTPLIGAVQELKAENDSLKAENADFKTQLEALRADVEALKAARQ